jgi:Zn-dependent peptidase ImmA (M78 family)
VYNVNLVPSKIKKEAAKGASTLLEAVSWPEGLLPVEPVYIARKIGVQVINAALDRDILGALVKKAGQQPTILINENDHDHRRRFTCAHELGHFIRRSPSWSLQEGPYLTLEASEETAYETVDLRSQASSEGTEPEEIYANEFAACLLMPPEEVRKHRDEPLAVLASRFWVSEEAVAFRLKNLAGEEAEKKRLLPLG